ncbi:Fluffing protein [Delftia tsuruhatensis]|nr:Fluffing protein [Delftia tsuruhatensis]
MPELPNYRPEVPLAMAAPALAQRLGLGMLGAGLHDRIGGQLGGEAAQGLWARAFGESGSVGRRDGSDAARLEGFRRHGPGYDLRASGLQMGRDVQRIHGADGGQVRAGFYGGLGRINGDVLAVYAGRAGSVAMDAYALGAYWSRWGDAGWYADATLQGMRYGRVRMHSSLGESLRTDGWGLAASLEGGYALALGDGWKAVPQAQLLYQRTSLADVSDRFGHIRFDAADAMYLRLGARLEQDWAPPGGERMLLWARANLWRTMGSAAKTTFTTLDGSHPVTLRTGLGRTWGQVGVGFTGRLGPRASLSGSLDYSQGFETGRDQAVTGRLLWTLAW